MNLNQETLANPLRSPYLLFFIVIAVSLVSLFVRFELTPSNPVMCDQSCATQFRAPPGQYTMGTEMELPPSTYNTGAFAR
jgi:hypothetical protein